MGQKICELTKKAGAEGGTTFLGKGASAQAFRKVFGLPLEEAREVVLTMVKKDLEDQVFDAIQQRCELDKPVRGIAFILETKRVVGITYLLDEDMRQKIEDEL